MQERDQVDEADVDLEGERHRQHQRRLARRRRRSSCGGGPIGPRARRPAGRGPRSGMAVAAKVRPTSSAVPRLGDQRAQRDDVDPIAEQRDELAGPQQREVAVARPGAGTATAPARPARRPAAPLRHSAGIAEALRVGDAGLERSPPWIGGSRDCAQRQRAARRRLGAGHRVHDGPEDPQRQQHVADADHVADDRDRQRDDVAEQAAAGRRSRRPYRSAGGSGTGR